MRVSSSEVVQQWNMDTASSRKDGMLPLKKGILVSSLKQILLFIHHLCSSELQSKREYAHNLVMKDWLLSLKMKF
jgi:hypothetical protein